eukprot:TRINITY_DN16124_c0_g1_i2.p1 TRINITY_DN16124_c0_g1~~TRINITY_DN16124_c0_g1_i2.p1  ORF type:complete len:266 (+),score=58.81 TRINITY_DN16124_c0_g1_i2:110-907(+)
MLWIPSDCTATTTAAAPWAQSDASAQTPLEHQSVPAAEVQPILEELEAAINAAFAPMIPTEAPAAPPRIFMAMSSRRLAPASANNNDSAAGGPQENVPRIIILRRNGDGVDIAGINLTTLDSPTVDLGEEDASSLRDSLEAFLQMERRRLHEEISVEEDLRFMYESIVRVAERAEREAQRVRSETIEALPRRSFDAAALAAEDGAGQERDEYKCLICIEDFAAGEEVVTLPCRHLFHADCAREWLKVKLACPTCRHRLTRESREV